MSRGFAIGLVMSTAVAAGTIGVQAVAGSHGGWGDFMLFSILPKAVQNFGGGARYVAKPLLAAVHCM